MSYVIYKYKLEVDEKQRIEMPKHAQIQSLDVIDDIPYFWAVHNTEYSLGDTEERIFWTFPTGVPIPVSLFNRLQYGGMYKLDNGKLVFHLYEQFFN